METLRLADTDRHTSRLGYGCSSLMGSLGRRQSLALLEEAFDAGIRHFDVAPMYGFGEAEGCLGEFLARHRGEITITTKFGIEPARNRRLLNLARSIARPLLQAAPSLRRRMAGTAEKVAATGTRSTFSVPQAAASLERSLRLLRTGRIDIWLLHEAEAGDLHDDALLRFMEDRRQRGEIGAFGVGSTASLIPPLLEHRRPYCGVLQFEWSILDAPPAEVGSFRIHHRTMTDRVHSLHAALLGDAGLCGRWSQLVGQPLDDPRILSALMLSAACESNPGSIILFSSKKKEHIRRNVSVCEDARLRGAAVRLRALLADAIVVRGHQAGVSISRTSS